MPSELTDAEAQRAIAIRVERVRRRLKQEDVAALAGIDQATVSRAELGRGSDDIYATIAKALEIELAESQVVGE